MAGQAKQKIYKVKVPVFASEIKTDANNIYGGITYAAMISYVERKINSYNQTMQNSGAQKIKGDKRNKTFEKEIDRVDFTNHQLGNVPTILLQISAYNTNLIDGYGYFKSNKTLFAPDDKVGNYNNFALMYPRIYGGLNGFYEYQWLILIYEDPTKENEDIVRTVKLVLKKMLGIEIANIKLDALLKDIARAGGVPELVITLTGIVFEETGNGTKYSEFRTGGTLKKKKVDKFLNIPFKESKEIIEDKTYVEEGFQDKLISLFYGKKVVKIENEYRTDAEEKINQTVEEIFNASTEISKEELKELHNPDFIMSKLKPILDNYLSSVI